MLQMKPVFRRKVDIDQWAQQQSLNISPSKQNYGQGTFKGGHCPLTKNIPAVFPVRIFLIRAISSLCCTEWDSLGH